MSGRCTTFQVLSASLLFNFNGISSAPLSVPATNPYLWISNTVPLPYIQIRSHGSCFYGSTPRQCTNDDMAGQYQIRPFQSSSLFLIINLLSSNCLAASPAANSGIRQVNCGNPSTLGMSILWNISFNNDGNYTWTITSQLTLGSATMSWLGT